MEIAETITINGHRLASTRTDIESNTVVIFCHGFRSSSIGPNRFFVRAARQLAERGIASVRFDQYGSGNSEGNFMDSSFNDWVDTTKAIAQDYLDKGYKVFLFGQSMGGATVIVASADLPKLAGVVSWVPDASMDTFEPFPGGFMEEGGERVQSRYWEEAHNANIAGKLSEVKAPGYIVQCSDDQYVSTENHRAIETNAQPHHTVEMFEGRQHSSWSYDDATEIIGKSVSFIVNTVKA